MGLLSLTFTQKLYEDTALSLCHSGRGSWGASYSVQTVSSGSFRAHFVKSTDA